MFLYSMGVNSSVCSALLQPIALSIRTFRMSLGLSDLLLCRVEVVKGRMIRAIDVNLECEHDEHRRNCGDPTESFEAELKTDCCEKR